ncbi:MAG: hypothetical protein BGO91_13685 [Leifsonia sp. 71-9]|nr:MAG: hypothetical protein BGO91_13685 [Leifsonia sp. 71-9]
MRETFRDDEIPSAQDVKDRWMHASRAETHAKGEAEFDRWLVKHDAAVRKEALREAAEVIKRILVAENRDEWSKGVEWSAAQGIAALRALAEGEGQ